MTKAKNQKQFQTLEFRILNLFRISKFGFRILLAFVFSLLLVSPTFAAEFILTSESSTFGVGQEFLVTLVVDTEGQAINAFEGEIVFPEELIELKSIREKGSIVNLWVQDPPSFSGLTPGGYAGEGVLFSLLFEAKAEGRGEIALERGRALLNDGKGTPAELEISNFKFLISNEILSLREISRSETMTETNDTEAPEPFELKIAHDPLIFDGKPFLVFAARDKDSGISHYEASFMRHGKRTEWQGAKSPFLLEQYEEIEKIWVKAVDRTGNERIVSLQVKNSFLRFLLWGNIVILGIIGGMFGFWLWRKRIQK